jgi:hypothetical protein
MFKLMYFKYCKIASAVLISLLLFVSCSKDKETNRSIVILKAETASSHSVTFNITPLSVDKCAWMCVKSDAMAPSVDEILTKGVYVDVANISKQTAIGLEPNTSYIIYVAVQYKGVNILSKENLSVSTTVQKELPIVENVYELNNMLEALYSTDNAQGDGNYYLSLSSCPIDEEGMPTALNGVVVRLDMFGPADDDPMNATLPSGEYSLNSDSDLYFGKTYSFVFKKIGSTSEDILSTAISGGKVIVDRSGDEYTININVVLSNDEVFKAVFKGSIMFVQSGTSSYIRFDKPQDVTFTNAIGRYYGNWFYPHADDISLQFSSGTLDANGNMIDGYVLTLPLYMEKHIYSPTDNPVIKEGVYNVIQQVPALNFIPYTYVIGRMEELFGSVTPNGTYLQQIDGATGKKYLGLANSGTVKVTRVGDDYEVIFDFVSEKGIALKGKFVGSINIKNFCNNSSMPARPWSTLTEDVSIKFPDDAKFTAYYMSNYLYPGLNSWQVTLASDAIEGEMITAEFFTSKEDGKTIKPGKYTISNKFEAYNMLPGFQPFGTANVVYTWYGDLSTKDEDGYAGKLAPITSGTMDVTLSGDIYTFKFNFVDDKGLKIIGSWSGKVDYKEFVSGIEGTSVTKSNSPLIMMRD